MKKTTTFFLTYAIPVFFMIAVVVACNPKPKPAAWQSISGAYYDYTKTMKPEKPYVREYSRTLTMKIYLAQPDGKGGSQVFITFEQALEYLRMVDEITRGVPKIVYLVGWQYNGHDDRYPAWHEVNKALKREQDSTALESFLWLKQEALKYNTTISVHINMTDSYDNSPLWDEYVKNDLIARNADGSLYKLGEYNNISTYQICYTREWDTGYAQKRIDEIIELLQLESAGTVHLDAFFPRTSDYHKITQDMETQAMRKIYRYWRSKGIDVTSEQQSRLRPDPFIGLQPMSWWFDLSAKQQAEIPASLACGGMPYQPNDSIAGFLFGQHMHGEDLFGIYGVTNWVPQFKKQFCTTTLQACFQNTQKLQAYDSIANTTTYSNGLILAADGFVVKENGRLLREDNDVFIPVTWKDDKEIIVFSEMGYSNKTWELPESWKDITAVDVFAVTENGLVLKTGNIPVREAGIALSLEPGEEVSVVPVKEEN